MPVWAKDFHVLQGEPKPWRHSSPTEVALASWFCGDCGARLYGDRQGREHIINLRAGTLDDTSWLKPIAHFFMTSAQDWMRSAAIAECHETTDSADVLPLAAAWRANWPDFFTTSPFSQGTD